MSGDMLSSGLLGILWARSADVQTCAPEAKVIRVSAEATADANRAAKK
jgi:hypothetical protein